MLTYLSLFSGAGGGDMALDAAGYQCVGQIEIDRHCQSVLARHWPDVPKYGDITTVDPSQLTPADVVLFGSPCQDLSVAGRRAGFNGDRSSLFFEAIRIIEGIQHATDYQFPRVAIWENVPGALNSNAGADFAAALSELARTRAHLIEWCVVDARHWVPQRRRRVFVAAVYDSGVADRCPDPVFTFGESCCRDSEAGESAREDTASSLTGSLGTSGPDAAHALANWMVPVQTSTGTITAGAHPGSYNAQDVYNDMLVTFVKNKGAQTTTDWESWSQSDTAPTLNSFDVGDIRAKVLAIDTQFGSNAGVFDDMSPPVKSTQQPPTVLTGLAVRRLLPIECEKLQGWPDLHTAFDQHGKPLSDAARYRMIGNGIATPALRWIVDQITPHL